MALSNLDKDNLNRLFSMISIDENSVNSIKSNYSTYAKLEVILNQIENLKLQANKIINDHNSNIELNNIYCNFKKVPGNVYYLYEINGEKKLSLIPDTDFTAYLDTQSKYLGKYLYNYDHQFYFLDN